MPPAGARLLVESAAALGNSPKVGYRPPILRAVRPAPSGGGVMSVIKFLVSRRAAGGLLLAVAAGIVAAAAFAGGSADAQGNGPEIATLVKSRSSFRGDVRALPQLPPQAVARPERPD